MGVSLSPSVLDWTFVETPPLSGEENMRWDNACAASLAAGNDQPTLRLFRFSEPTVTYGRLQQLDVVKQIAPSGWPLVQRPTAGGIVFHEHDICVSLCWKRNDPSLPHRPRDAYRWIHGMILRALLNFEDVHLAACAEVCSRSASFHKRQCFQEPVGYDVLLNSKKVVGGAMVFKKNIALYQGSIQLPSLPDDFLNALRQAFQAISR